MNSKAIKIIRNFTYSFTSSLVSMIISSLVILIVPKLIGIKEYGYWQLYLFYSSYVGFLHLGWNDGIYLRYGGKKYDELDKRLFFSQFYMLLYMLWCHSYLLTIHHKIISVFPSIPFTSYSAKLKSPLHFCNG